MLRLYILLQVLCVCLYLLKKTTSHHETKAADSVQFHADCESTLQDSNLQ